MSFTADVKELKRLFMNNALGLSEWGGVKGEKMKRRELERKYVMPLNLQFFAGEGDGTGNGEGDGGGAGSGGTGDGGGAGGTQTFDELLASGHQAEFDRRVQKAIDTAVKNAQDKWKTLTDDKVSEAEKLAKMNAQEKAQYMQEKKERELAERESNLNKRELMATAKNTLAEKSLPLGLAEVLNYADAEACNKSIAAVEKAFQDAVEAAVNERLKGGEPPKKNQEMEH